VSKKRVLPNNSKTFFGFLPHAAKTFSTTFHRTVHNRPNRPPLLSIPKTLSNFSSNNVASYQTSASTFPATAHLTTVHYSPAPLLSSTYRPLFLPSDQIDSKGCHPHSHTVVRSYLGYYTGSHQNSAVKRPWARIVLGWVTSREVLVLHPNDSPFYMSFLPSAQNIWLPS
jgi:hypothetical protein